MLQPSKDKYGLTGYPQLGLWTSTLGLFAGLTTIVLYGVAGPEFKESLGLSGAMLGVLISSPHLSKAILRVPFGAWVDEVGGKKPFLILLGCSILGLAGITGMLYLYYPNEFDESLFPLFLLFGVLGGAGGATFSVGVPKTSYWFPKEKQGHALGIYAGLGNIGPGVLNYVIPLLIGAIGLAAAYLSWLVFLIAASVIFAIFAVDSYYFQLVKKDVNHENAKSIAKDLGQDVFPSGGTWISLKHSASNYRTWILVFLYTISFGGGFTALTAWFPTYWTLFHGMGLMSAGLIAAVFTIYGSLIRIPGGKWSDKFGGENVAILSFVTMAFGALVLTITSDAYVSFFGMIVIGTGMGIANAAIFELVPKYIPDAVGGASGWIGGVGGAGTLLIIPILGAFVDIYGQIGYARGFIVIAILSVLCAIIAYALKLNTQKKNDRGTFSP
ncbi:MFS transporter [Cyclobacterium plantarum]|uniref:MFS transporter n=1 Tax=Cyclobacterium plantarum TaxID=2716263 RepID=A0ABX0H3V2_9BACT|nr:MFS transporter [Cyclobacterium plantarum]NHE56505.1 MFS transporter [Cyclobacterium plantarum]